MFSVKSLQGLLSFLAKHEDEECNLLFLICFGSFAGGWCLGGDGVLNFVCF